MDYRTILGLLFIGSLLFLFIIHRIRRSEMPPEFNWDMDFDDFDIIATVEYLIQRMKGRPTLFKEADVVTLNRRIGDVRQDTSGTVLVAYKDKEHFKVEFLDDKGNTELLTVSWKDIERKAST